MLTIILGLPILSVDNLPLKLLLVLCTGTTADEQKEEIFPVRVSGLEFSAAAAVRAKVTDLIGKI
jgi:hypothetical protein